MAACRIALGGVGPSVVRASSAEAALTGRPLDRAAAEEAGRRAVEDIDPFDDAYASAWYRRAGDAGARAPRADRGVRAMKKAVVELTINGAERQMLVVPGATLLDTLRDAGPDRHPARLRPGRLRRLHRAGRRPADDVLPAAGRDHRGRAGRARSRG